MAEPGIQFQVSVSDEADSHSDSFFEQLSRQELVRKLRALMEEIAQLKRELKEGGEVDTDPAGETGEPCVVSGKEVVRDMDEEEPRGDEDKKRSSWGSSLDSSEAPSDAGAGDIEMQAQKETGPQEEKYAEVKIELPGEPEESKETKEPGVDQEEPRKGEGQKRDATLGSSLDNSGNSEARQEGPVAAKMPTHHKVWSLEVLEKVKGKMKRGDTMEVWLQKKLLKDGSNSTADMDKVQVAADFLKTANGEDITATKLDLGGNKLGVEGMEILAEHLPREGKLLRLSYNNLGDEGMEILGKHLSKKLKVLGLTGNDLGVDGMKVIVEHIPKELTDLDLRANGLDGALDWEPLLRFLLREGLLSSNLVIHGVEDSESNPMLYEGMHRGLVVFSHPPVLSYFAKALVLKFGTQAATVRWVVVLSCIVAFVLPVIFSSEGDRNSDNDDEAGNRGRDGSNQSSSSFIAFSLGEVCGSNTEALGDLFVDPVSGLMAVVVVAVMFLVYQAFAGTVKSLAVYIIESLFSCGVCNVVNGGIDGAKPIFGTGIYCALNKVQRSFFLFVHLQVLFFVLGDYFIWSNPVSFDSVLCRSALTTTIIFYKPFIVPTFYCLNYLSDATGRMLWHNPLTDSIVAMLLVLLLLWTVVAFTFSLPLLVCFFFFTLAFFVPPIAYFLKTKDAIFSSGIQKPGEDKKDFGLRMQNATEEQRNEGEAAAMIFKRLVFYSFFACLVFGVVLYPFYEGDGYVETIQRVSAAVLPSLSFWSPEFALSFSWPRVSFPSQIALGLSIGAISLESLLLAWQDVLACMYPLGYAFDGMYDESALHKAAREGSANTVKVLVDAKVKLDLLDADGMNALHIAAEKGSADVVKILVHAKANLDLVNKDGMSALHWAVSRGYANVVEILVDAKAKLDLVNKDGMSALCIAAEKNSTDVVKILVHANASIDLVDKDGMSALCIAAEKSSTDVVKILVHAKANLDLVEKNGNSALCIAAKKGSADMVKILVDAKANINIVDKWYGKSALHIAALKGSADVVKILVDAKAKLDLVDKNFDTAREVATESKRGEWEEVVKLLDAHAVGCDMGLKDAEADTTNPMFLR